MTFEALIEKFARHGARGRARRILRRRAKPGPTFPIRETFEVN